LIQVKGRQQKILGRSRFQAHEVCHWLEVVRYPSQLKRQSLEQKANRLNQ
jgi:hypothetical protein